MSWYPPRSVARQADGLKARKSSQGFASQWWSQRWLGALQALNYGSRLERGKRYARAGQVLDYRVEGGQLTSRVQGSRARPYEVRIGLKLLTLSAWSQVLARLRQHAGQLASLLAGEMPREIERVFAEAGANLLPAGPQDLTSSCSCPDWANPCKHVAAVHYIVAEALDEDPFIMFQLRGMERAQLLNELGLTSPEEAPSPPQLELVPCEPERFWRAPDLEGLSLDLSLPAVPCSVLRRLGPPGRWVEPEAFVAAFTPLMEALSQRAREQAGVGEESLPKTRGSRKARPEVEAPQPVAERALEPPGKVGTQVASAAPLAVEPPAGVERPRQVASPPQLAVKPPAGVERPRQVASPPQLAVKPPARVERSQVASPRPLPPAAERPTELAGPRGLSRRQSLMLRRARSHKLETSWIMQKWRLSPTEARLELKELVSRGWLERRGSGRGTHYVAVGGSSLAPQQRQ